MQNCKTFRKIHKRNSLRPRADVKYLDLLLQAQSDIKRKFDKCTLSKLKELFSVNDSINFSFKPHI